MTAEEKLEAIRAEILRLVEVRGHSREMANDLLTFMNSLPTDNVSDDLEKEKERLFGNCKVRRGAFELGAKWQEQKTINKAIKWLKENVTYTHPRKGTEECIVNINAFKEAMED